MTSDPKEATFKELVETVDNINKAFSYHDQAIFEMVACVNSLQEIVVAKGICTQEEMAEAVKKQLNILRENVIRAMDTDHAPQSAA